MRDVAENRENFILLTGAPGSGKSTLLLHLQALGFQGVAEPARQILSEQRSIDGNGVPDRDVRLFVELMLSRAIYEFERMADTIVPVFFDRGIPDIVGYASHFGFDYPPGRNAARKYCYNRDVFFAPSWQEIYATDEERTMSFEAARQFGDELRAVYEQSGYRVIHLPCVSVEERARYLLSFI